MTMPLDELFTFDPELCFGEPGLATRRAGTLPLAKSIVDAAQLESERILDEAKRNASILTQEATQTGYEEGMNRAAGQIFAAAELEHRCATAVIRHALPILCEAIGREFGVSSKVAALQAAVEDALRNKRITPPFTITVSEEGEPAVRRMLARNGATEREAVIASDGALAPGSCRISNSAGGIEIDIEAHLEGFLRRLARHQELREALIDDLIHFLRVQQ